MLNQTVLALITILCTGMKSFAREFEKVKTQMCQTIDNILVQAGISCVEVEMYIHV